MACGSFSAVESRHHITQVKVFGSAVHGANTPHSDIDLLVSFSDGASLLDQAGFQREAEDLPT
ncbi:nucleotidyltransferase domain-containing protein [Agreia bicolorata]|uniref:nucleotidyltransferase family protein n=1 Tax=Agreia bicolorata TaxID=110935 RepID=UPI00099998A0